MASPLPDSLASELRRKAIHLSLLLLIPLGRALGPRHAPLALALALALSLGVEVLRRGKGVVPRGFHRCFGASLRAHERDGVLGSTVLLATCLVLAFWVSWPAMEVVLATVLVGDAAAALAGRACHPLRRGRSGVGSAAYLAAATSAALGLGIAPVAALALGISTAAAERLAGGLHVDDNTLAPLAAALVLALSDLS